jgi:hypothetical protein|tara:strand:- start:60 stop:740 length:681 start_codon:yes stop_codon:yes gene_type:complete
MPTVEISNYGTFAGPGAGDGNSNPVTTFNDNEDNDPIQTDDSDFAFIDESNIAVCLAASSSSYARFRCNGTNTSNVTIDNNSGALTTLTLNSATTNVSGDIVATGTITATGASAQVKAFNIPHPTKEGKRLWHGCLEGPEYGVYVRGRLKNNNTIELPEYWTGLVDPDSITVQLTPMGASQDLIVDSINWGRQVVVRSVAGTGIDCFYLVQGTRVDVPPLEVEQDA